MFDIMKGDRNMPILARFEGITINMYWEAGGKHKVPHLHSKYAGKEAVYTINGRCIAGKLPANKDTLIRAWIQLRQKELIKAAVAMQNNQNPGKIAPLK